MDVNGTRYQLLLGVDDWGSCSDAGTAMRLADAWNASATSPAAPNTFLYWDGQRNQISLQPLVYAFVPGKGDLPRSIADRRGSAADRFGNWYFIDSTQTQVLVRSSGCQTTTVFWPPQSAPVPSRRDGAFGPVRPAGLPEPRFLSGLAVTTNHYLVVGALDPSALFIFDLYAGGEPRELLWPPDVPFSPFDMAPGPHGGLWILDSTNDQYWLLDANFSVCELDQTSGDSLPIATQTFGPVKVGSSQTMPLRRGYVGGFLGPASLVASSNPIAIDGFPDGTVLILDRPAGSTSYIQHYRGSTLLEAPFPLDRMRDLLQNGAAIDFTGHDLVFVSTAGSDPLAGRVLVALASGNQCLAFGAASNADGTLRLWPLADFYPMRLFGGRAVALAAAAPYYDFADHFVPLVAQKRPRFVPQGTLVTPIFDGGAPGCVWHRLIMDASIPIESTIQVFSRASDDQQSLSETPFLAEPARLVQRSQGPELAFATLPSGLSSWELLFQQARGRYLQLQIQLTGNGKHSPRIRALRAYYPRFSYLKEYLPAVYSDNDKAGFLDRFLANIEGTLTAIEDRMAAAQVFFDPTSAPSDALEWLASWFSVALDPAWDDIRRRLFIRHAMDLFQWRGTVRGIQMALDLALSQYPCDSIFTRDDNKLPSGTRIIEQFATRVTPSVVLGDPTGTDYVAVASSAATPQWTPDRGGALLLSLWQTAVAAAVGGAVPSSFPLTAPADAATATAWTNFARATLGFVPSPTSAEKAMRWTQFLYHRYLTITTLNGAYAGSYASFANVLLFTTLPPDGPQLVDWFQFESLVISIAQNAHRFRVLVPLVPGATSDDPQQQQRLDLVTRLVTLEQPAHTTFDVRFYWAMFRVGQARLGFDTLLDQGSRVPALAPSMVLGTGHLLEGHLSPNFPQDATNRDILGRNSVGHDSIA